MGEFFRFLADHRSGIWMFLLGLGAVCLLTQWVCWIFRLGRFTVEAVAGTPRPPNPLRFVVAEFFVRLIDNFRHLLALVVITMFAVALFAAMVPGLSRGQIADVKEGLQAVAAALAGLIGSIIGYYFGESAAAAKDRESKEPTESSQPPVQGAPLGESQTSEIRPAARPPSSG